MLNEIFKDLISRTELIFLHKYIIDKYGGSDGLLSTASLDSILNNYKTTYDGKFLYDTELKRCCRLIWCIGANHAFQDGNKRTALIVLDLLQSRNHIKFDKISETILRDIMLDIASHKLDYDSFYDLVNKELNID